MSEIALRTELLIQIYQLVEETSANRVDRAQLESLATEFGSKSKSIRVLLKEKFRELRQTLDI